MSSHLHKKKQTARAETEKGVGRDEKSSIFLQLHRSVMSENCGNGGKTNLIMELAGMASWNDAGELKGCRQKKKRKKKERRHREHVCRAEGWLEREVDLIKTLQQFMWCCVYFQFPHKHNSRRRMRSVEHPFVHHHNEGRETFSIGKSPPSWRRFMWKITSLLLI